MNTLWLLYSAFFRIGAFTFGGGYAMLPLLEKELINTYGWVTKDELIDFFAISQCIPGVIAVNTATFVGCKIKGPYGGLIAALGVVTPSLVIILLIASLVQHFADGALVQHAFAGVRVAVVVLIANTLFFLIKASVKSKRSLCFFVITFLAVAFCGVNPAYIIILSAVIGYWCFPQQGGQDK